MMTQEEIRELAQLAMLLPEEDELASLARDLEKTLAFAGAVASVPQAEEAPEDGWRCPLREDAEEPSLPQEEILQNAPSRADGYFLLEDRG